MNFIAYCFAGCELAWDAAQDAWERGDHEARRLAHWWHKFWSMMFKFARMLVAAIP